MEDWNKLKRVITWLKQTINDVRIIGCKNLDGLFTWVDVSYVVWDITSIQDGGRMLMGCRMIHAKSGKQQLNTKISKEA